MGHKSEDLRYRRKIYEEKQVSAGFGAESAMNMFSLQWRDFLQRSDRNELAIAKIGENSDIELLKSDKDRVEKLEKRIQDREEKMEEIRQAELKNLEEYQAFYDNLPNTPARLLSSLSYGAVKNTLNPIELGKSYVLNQLTLGIGNPVVSFGANVVVDAIDNFYTNRYEDKLLNISRDTSLFQEGTQAVGGALATNGIIPTIKFGGKVIKGTFNIPNIFDVGVRKTYVKELENVDIVDYFDADPKMSLLDKKYRHLGGYESDGETFSVNLKQQMKVVKDGYETGVDTSGYVDYREFARDIERIPDEPITPIIKSDDKGGIDIGGFVEEVTNVGHAISRDSAKSLSKKEKKLLKKGVSKGEVLKAYGKNNKETSVAIKRNAQEITFKYVESPLNVYEHIIKEEWAKDIIGLDETYRLNYTPFSSLQRSLNERFAEDLQENTVVDAIIESITGNELSFLTKDGAKIDGTKISEFSSKKIKEFREIIGAGVTHNKDENLYLWQNDPVMSRYLSSGDNYEVFEDKINHSIADFLNRKISLEDFEKVMYYQKSNYEYFEDIHMLDVKFEPFILDKFIKITKEHPEVYDEVLEIFTERGSLDPEKLKIRLDEIKKRKIDSALMSLLFNKEHAFNFFIKNTDKNGKLDIDEMGAVFKTKIFSLKKNEGETTIQALERFVKDLRNTTNWKMKIADDIEGLGYEQNVYRDLRDVIADNFKGKTIRHKMLAFADFMSDFKHDNITVLNMMQNMIANEKASLQVFGVPLYAIRNAVENERGLLKLVSVIPQLRKDLPRISKTFASDTAIANEMQSAVLESLKNFLSRKDVFKKVVQPDLFDKALNSAFWAVKNYYLFGSGIAETFAHPLLVATKGARFYDGNFYKSLGDTTEVLPQAFVLTGLNEFKVVADTSLAVNKLFKTAGAFIGGDDGELVTSLEISKLSAIAVPKKKGTLAVEGAKSIARAVSDVALHIQNSMQVLRFYESNLVALKKVRDIFSYDKFEDIKGEELNILKMVGIKDNEKYKNFKKVLWETVDENGKNIGWATSLYKQGVNDEVKYIKGYIADILYSEDYLKNVRRSLNLDTSLVQKSRSMFTTFSNDLVNYLLDNAKHYRDGEGIYRSRFSADYLKHIKKYHKETLIGASGSLTALSLLALGSLAGKYLEGKAIGSSDDELSVAQLKSMFTGDGNFRRVMDIGSDLALSSTGFDTVLKGGGIANMWENMWDRKFVPKRISTRYQAFKGTPVYKEPFRKDWYTKALYYEEVDKDIKKRAGIKEDKKLFEENRKVYDLTINAMNVAFIESMEEKGMLPQGSGLEAKRELLGYDDKGAVEEIKNSSNYELLEAVSMAQGDDDNLKNIFMYNLENAQSKGLLNGNREELLDELGIDENIANRLIVDSKLTKEEEMKLDKYVASFGLIDEFKKLLATLEYKKRLINERILKRLEKKFS